MTDSSQSQRQRSLAELFSELAALKVDLDGLSHDVADVLEQNWVDCAPGLRPLVLAWAASWPVQDWTLYNTVSPTFSVVEDLSWGSQRPTAGSSCRLPPPVRPSRLGPLDAPASESLSVEVLGEPWATLCLRALAAREFEMDFATGQAAFPLAILDRVVAVALVQFEAGQVGPSDWSLLCKSLSELAESMRRTVLEHRLAQAALLTPSSGKRSGESDAS
jgi:hypothetical protein